MRYDEGTTVEWEVAWFPFDGGDKARVFTDEEKARALFETCQAEGSAPMLSRREITATPWQTVENPTLDAIRQQHAGKEVRDFGMFTDAEMDHLQAEHEAIERYTARHDREMAQSTAASQRVQATAETCWCGGEVGPRVPGDARGLGCVEDINHAPKHDTTP